MTDSLIRDRPLETYFWQLAKALLAFLSVIVYSRYLGASGRGTLSIYLLYVQVFLMVNEIFVGSALANWIAEFGLRRFLPRIIGISLILLGAAYGISVFTGWQQQQSQGISPLLGSWILVLVIQNVALNYFQSKGWVLEKMKWLVGFEALKIAFLLGCVLSFSGFWGFEPLGNVLLMLNIAGWLWTFIVLVRMFTLSAFIPHHNHQSIRHTWLQGLWAQLGQIVLFFIYRLPVFMAQYFMNDAAAGILANVLLVIDTVWIFANTLGMVLHGRALQNLTVFKKEKLCMRYTYWSVGVTVILMGIVVGIPGAVYAAVFGEEFVGMNVLLLQMIPGILALSVFASLGNLFHALNQFKTLFFHHSIGLLVMITGFIGAYHFGESVTFTPLVWSWNLALMTVMCLHWVRRKFVFKNHPNMIFNVLLIWRLLKIKQNPFRRR
jgi:O-antigen/teichoic acid export membrane protein